MPVAVLPSPQSMVMLDPLTGNHMAWFGELVVQVVTKAWSGAWSGSSRKGSVILTAVTRMI